MTTNTPVFPEVAGRPTLHNTFIPQIWSPRIVANYYDKTVLKVIANTEFEGAIRGQGDTVFIRLTPDITIRKYSKGQAIIPEIPEAQKIQLVIDRSNYFAAAEDDVDKVQTDVNQMQMWTEIAAKKLMIETDKDVLRSIVADVHPMNRGKNAGARSMRYNLGTDTEPVWVRARQADNLAAETVGTTAATAKSIVRHITQMGTVLDEQNVPEEGRYLIVPPAICELLINSELGDAYASGDNVSMKRRGWQGRIGDFEIYKSQLLKVGNISVGGNDVQTTTILAGVKTGLTFAMQVTKTEMIRPESSFSDIIRGLQVYGFQVTKPADICASVIAININ